jgi:hypothetical protein
MLRSWFPQLRKHLSGGTSRSRPGARKPHPVRPDLELLEKRDLPSGMHPTNVLRLSGGPNGPAPFSSAGPRGFTPAQVRHAYGFDQISFNGSPGDGTGTTIAIVDAFDDPNVASDLRAFDARFGLPDPTFTKVNQSGGSTLPPANGRWAGEIALDVEWSHAIAPRANILLVEANDNSYANLFTAVRYAAYQPGVVAVSMSFGGSEFASETANDSTFLTPAGHPGVTFVASSGDHGAPPSYPAVSPNVLAVGGTTLTLNANNTIQSETGWSQGSDWWDPTLASGGGISAVESQPAYQRGVVTQSSTMRTSPDVAYDADPNTGFPVYDSFNNGTQTPWSETGGTSAAAPQWAALIAIADQGRALAGQASLDGPHQTLPALYALPATDFHDVTSGNNGFSAGPGYDLVTGRGTPVANQVVADLARSNLAVINYGNTPQAENVFRVGRDGNLYVDHYSPTSGWSWVNQGNPGVGLAGSPTAVNYGTANVENVFVVGADGNLYVDHYSPTSGWSWVNQGNPGGVHFASNPVAIEYGSGSTEVENVFVTGTNGNLYADHYSPTSGWSWVNQGNPGVGFASSPTVVNYGTANVENVFLTGADGNLYVDHYAPSSGWHWVNQGNPVGVRFVSNPVAIEYGSGSTEVENVFLTATNGNLYMDHYTPSSGWIWVNQGNPGVGFAGSPTAVNYGTANIENVFVVGTNGNLYVDYYNPSSGWRWLNQGNPGVGFASNPAAIDYGSGSTELENVFVTGFDGNLYVDHYSPTSGWSWVNQGTGGFTGNLAQAAPASTAPPPSGARAMTSALPSPSQSGRPGHACSPGEAGSHRGPQSLSRARVLADLYFAGLAHHRRRGESLPGVSSDGTAPADAD